MGTIEVVEELLSHSECSRFLDLEDHHGRAALHEAAAHGNTHIVTMLLNSGAQIDMPDGYGMTSLHLAVWLRGRRPEQESSNLLTLAEDLVDLGSEVNTRDYFGKAVQTAPK